MGKERNLILVHTDDVQDVADFHAIKKMVEDQASDIEVFIASNLSRSSLTRKQAAHRPTLVFSPMQLMSFQPERGRVYSGHPMSKLTEMDALLEGGLPVPHYEELRPSTKLDPDMFGPFTVVKPAYEFSSFGQGNELIPTHKVTYRPPSAFPAHHPGSKGPMIAQRFIDCGYAMTARVLTIFGETVFTYVREATKPLSLDPTRDSFKTADYMPAPPDVRVYMTRDADMLELAAEAYRVMPEIPVQACDILRDRDGKLHILEINPGGATWMFSSQNASGYRQVLNIEDLTAPFDAFRTCARLLIEKTRLEAE